MNNSSDIFFVIALLFSAFSLFFSAFSWWETKKCADAAIKANYLSRLNSLFELQKGIRKEVFLVRILRNNLLATRVVKRQKMNI